jgi:spectinomycin phosphotransferase
MLEKPDLQDESIVACLQDDYGLHVAQVVFLPLGADLNTAVYRVITDDETSYFCKLRGGVFDETSVALPKFLSDQGIAQIIAPLATQAGQLWASLDVFKVILYPFIEGRNGYEVELSESRWRDFGAALKGVHTAVLPPALIGCIRRETYSPKWREIVRTFLGRVEDDVFDDPVAVELAAFLRAKRGEILDLVECAERHAQALEAQAPEFVLCHSDVHAGNILIDAHDALYIVDWDDPILAPKERDLMFVGGAQGFAGHTPQEEETLFYRGYGQTQVDPVALAYYRYERIVEDIAIYCEQLFLTDEGGEDREQSLRYLKSNFLPNGTIEIAYRSDRTLSFRCCCRL